MTSWQPLTGAFGAIVLCGGRSSRMGIPKLSLPFGPEVMLQRIVRIVSRIAQPVVVVAASEQDLPSLPQDVITIRDDEAYQGPLAGLAAGLTALQPYVTAAYASSCDVPFLEPAFVRRIYEQLNDHDLVMPQDADHHHPLAAVYRTSLAEIIRELLEAGQFRPVALLGRCRAKVIDVNELRPVDPDLRSLRNLNTREEYERALMDAGLEYHE